MKWMVKCMVCGHDVSEYAERCPQCGDLVARRFGNEPRRKVNPWMLLGWIVLAVVLLMLAHCVMVAPLLLGA